MTASSQPNEFGFKRLSLENWLTVDPVWDAFGKSEPSEWVHDLLKVNLDPVVPLAIRRLFETARGTLVYSLMFYPLLTIGTEQLFRVLEAAATNQCMAMNAPTKIKKFSDKLKWLLENHTIAQEPVCTLGRDQAASEQCVTSARSKYIRPKHSPCRT
jgi:hypothetical protein